MTSVRFVPLQSSVDISFWSELAQRKLQDYKLSEDPVEIHGTCSSCRHPKFSTSISFDRFSFQSSTHRPGFFKLNGDLYIFNTIENFKSFDSKEAIEKSNGIIGEATKEGRSFDEETQTWLLQRFILIVYANLKTHEFHYWFCFPCFKPSSPFTSSAPVSLSNIDTSTIEDWLTGPNCGSKPLMKAPGEQDSQKIDLICFPDPSHSPQHPSWLLRNLLYFLSHHEYPSLIKILCLRLCGNKVDYQLSKVFEVEIENIEWSGFVGYWEPDHKGKKAPRKVSLQSHFDPQKLAEDAVNLNIKLMLWRAAPDLNLDTITNTRCLLIGMGTLGCAVARCLLGWGITRLTLIDSETVSFSNPVRQSLYEFEDSLKGGKLKVDAAVEHLKRIHPAVEVEGHQLRVPMPGHPPFTQEDNRSVQLLHQLIDQTDVVFLLTDNRESRWLPTVVGSALKKIVINAALGFDSYLVMRHGVENGDQGTGGTALGCYFCNDVLAPGNSTANRALDQQCTVVRPGLAPTASALAVELMISILQHPAKAKAGISENGMLGQIPHMIRGSVFDFSQILMNTSAFHQCIACSKSVTEVYLQGPIQFVSASIEDENYLQKLSGVAELINSTCEGLENWEIDDDDDEL